MSALEPPPFLDSLREEFTRIAEADAQAAAAAPAGRRRARLRLPQLRFALPATVMLLALLAGVGGVVSGVILPTRDDGPGELAQRSDGDYGPALLGALSLLQQLPAPADELPPGLDERGLAKAAIRLAAPAPARTAGRPVERAAWVVPAKADHDRVALVIETSRGLGGTPGLTASDVEAGNAWLYADEESGGQTLLGIVPDGVAEVTVEFVSGEPVELPVRDNTFGALLPNERAIAGISWRGMAGP